MQLNKETKPKKPKAFSEIYETAYSLQLSVK